MKIFRWILFPFAVLYECILRLRNQFYDAGILGETEFDLPTISIGNLAFGGTGKTPHIEYLIRLLKDHVGVAVLSRGYKRKTSGYIFAEPMSTPELIGDEPWQIKQKFESIAVAVSENRVLGIPNLLMDAPHTQVVLLDDAFQHRPIKPGLNILLTDYNNRFTQDYLVPGGYLREYRSAYKRASIIIVTKCPVSLSIEEREKIKKELNPFPYQQVYFSYLKYGELTSVFGSEKSTLDKHILLVTGIANPKPLLAYLKSNSSSVLLKKYADHKDYQEKEFNEILSLYESLETPAIIVTTEKDRTKWLSRTAKNIIGNLPIFYIPIEVAFFVEDEFNFNQQIFNYVQQNSGNN